MGQRIGRKVWQAAPNRYTIFCPGCGCPHWFPTDDSNVVDGNVHKWAFNGNGDAPTFIPSMNVIGSCHSFVTDGRIQFLGDSKHQLAGQTVDLPDWDDDMWPD